MIGMTVFIKKFNLNQWSRVLWLYQIWFTNDQTCRTNCTIFFVTLKLTAQKLLYGLIIYWKGFFNRKCLELLQIL
jgi:hypothetical protein